MSEKSAPSRLDEELPYRIELWRDGKGQDVEKLLARAQSAHLARAIFQAAKEEHPERRITLRKGNRTIAESRV